MSVLHSKVSGRYCLLISFDSLETNSTFPAGFNSVKLGRDLDSPL